MYCFCRDQWVIVDDPLPETKANSYKAGKAPRTVESTSDAAQKKFGNAKAISSAQFFNDGDDYETKANLSRFQGSSSISSSDFFGNKQGLLHIIYCIYPNNKTRFLDNASASANPLQAYDLDDVKESVRQGVTKVAGKLSSLANGVMSSLQVNYIKIRFNLILIFFFLTFRSVTVISIKRREELGLFYLIFTGMAHLQ